MAIATAKEFASIDPVFLRPTQRCFLCAEVLAGAPWIYWTGADETAHQIWLHVNCAKRLSDHLNHDFENARRNSLG